MPPKPRRRNRSLFDQIQKGREALRQQCEQVRSVRGTILEDADHALHVVAPDHVQLIDAEGVSRSFSPAASAALLGPFESARTRVLRWAATMGAEAAVEDVEAMYASLEKLDLPPPVSGRAGHGAPPENANRCRSRSSATDPSERRNTVLAIAAT